MDCTALHWLTLTAFVVLVLAVLTKRDRRIPSWEKAAAQLGIVHSAGNDGTGPRLLGAVSGAAVEVTLVERPLRLTEETTFTRLEARLPRRLELGLHLSRQSLTDDLARVAGRQDIEVFDPEFDRLVRVRGRDPDGVRELLTPERCFRIKRMLDSYPGVVIDDEAVVLEVEDEQTDVKWLVQTVERMADLAAKLGPKD